MLNKAAFASVDFKYPYALTVVHMVTNTIGAKLYLAYEARKELRMTLPKAADGTVKLSSSTKPLTRPQQLAIFLFSIVFSLNIAIGNVSLRLVSVNFNQVMRSLVPAATMAFGLAQGKAFSSSKIVSVMCVIGGVACACYGELHTRQEHATRRTHATSSFLTIGSHRLPPLFTPLVTPCLWPCS